MLFLVINGFHDIFFSVIISEVIIRRERGELRRIFVASLVRVVVNEPIVVTAAVVV